TGSTGSGGSSVSSPSGSSSGVRGGGTAVARPSREPRSSGARRGSSSEGASGAGASVPAYSRPRGNNAVRGEAVDRGNNPLPSRGDSYSYPYYGYDRYGYNSYYNNPYRYGMYPVYTGYGFFYYDPFWGGGGYGPYAGHGGYYSRERDDDRDDRDYNIGSVRLKVDPADGEVFVDGLYRGVVDDFDGVFQRLKLEAGAHQLEIRAAGYAPLVFDVLVTPGETTTYRGRLRK
ncbi:MAG: hypothetical protein H0X44_09045, partial [Acidobacteria bacterium]|nr:hypothetical protein [Acidobacteriota bacterium]